MNLEEDVEPFLSAQVCIYYWDTLTDHEDFRKIVNAIDNGGGQTCNVPDVLKALFEAGYIVRKK